MCPGSSRVSTPNGTSIRLAAKNRHTDKQTHHVTRLSVTLFMHSVDYKLLVMMTTTSSCIMGITGHVTISWSGWEFRCLWEPPWALQHLSRIFQIWGPTLPAGSGPIIQLLDDMVRYVIKSRNAFFSEYRLTYQTFTSNLLRTELVASRPCDDSDFVS